MIVNLFNVGFGGGKIEDVPITAYAAAWIKELNVENIAIACGGGNYCPDASISRESTRKFIQRTLFPSEPTRDYTYGDPANMHAVTALSTGESYTYDENGNMTCRVENDNTYVQNFNAENRLSTVLLVSGTCAENGDILAGWGFTHDGNGTRVKQVYTVLAGRGSPTPLIIERRSHNYFF